MCSCGIEGCSNQERRFGWEESFVVGHDDLSYLVSKGIQIDFREIGHPDRIQLCGINSVERVGPGQGAESGH